MEDGDDPGTRRIRLYPLSSIHICPPQDNELGYMAQAELEPEFIVYAAWDVEPLHRYSKLVLMIF